MNLHKSFLIKNVLSVTALTLGLNIIFLGSLEASTVTAVARTDGEGNTTITSFPASGVPVKPGSTVHVTGVGKFDVVIIREPKPDPKNFDRIRQSNGNTIQPDPDRYRNPVVDPNGRVQFDFFEDGQKKGTVFFDGQLIKAGEPDPIANLMEGKLIPKQMIAIAPEEALDIFSNLFESSNQDFIIEVTGEELTLADVDFDFLGSDPFSFGSSNLSIIYTDGSQDNFNLAPTSTPVPEPSSILSLLALGTLGATSALKRNKKQEKEAIKVD